VVRRVLIGSDFISRGWREGRLVVRGGGGECDKLTDRGASMRDILTRNGPVRGLIAGEVISVTHLYQMV
jgi:hypothetical protein